MSPFLPEAIINLDSRGSLSHSFFTANRTNAIERIFECKFHRKTPVLSCFPVQKEKKEKEVTLLHSLSLSDARANERNFGKFLCEFQSHQAGTPPGAFASRLRVRRKPPTNGQGTCPGEVLVASGSRRAQPQPWLPFNQLPKHAVQKETEREREREFDNTFNVDPKVIVIAAAVAADCVLLYSVRVRVRFRFQQIILGCFPSRGEEGSACWKGAASHRRGTKSAKQTSGNGRKRQQQQQQSVGCVCLSI